ncbi:MAG: hypothetical protein AAGF26_08035, partial [Cyanobacteria bacterium P01_G01_bin.49]
MFEKFFGACTITLGLYIFLRLSNVLPPSSNVFTFKLSQIERFSVPTLQESIDFEQFSKLRPKTTVDSGIVAY